MAGNPNIGSADLNTRRIVAHGFRNPFRITVRPGTNEVWAGDVGWNTWEEIDRIPNPTASTMNFGWPCYEGNGRQGNYDNLNLNLCENLYTTGDTNVTAPYYTYNHSAHVDAADTCPTGGSSISGLAFYTGGSFRRRLQRRAVLRRLQPQLHLGDAARQQRAARPRHAPGVRARRRRAGRPAGRS